MIRCLLALVSVGCLAASPDDPYDAEQYTQCAGAISGGPDPNCAVYVYLRRPDSGVEAHAVKATKSAGVGGTRTPWRATAPPWPQGCTAGVSGALQWYTQE